MKQIPQRSKWRSDRILRFSASELADAFEYYGDRALPYVEHLMRIVRRSIEDMENRDKNLVTPKMLELLYVKEGKERVLLKDIAQAGLDNSNNVVLVVDDPSFVSKIQNAILSSNLGVNSVKESENKLKIYQRSNEAPDFSKLLAEKENKAKQAISKLYSRELEKINKDKEIDSDTRKFIVQELNQFSSGAKEALNKARAAIDKSAKK